MMETYLATCIMHLLLVGSESLVAVRGMAPAQPPHLPVSAS